MNTLVAIYLFLLGLAFGSFALVLVDRMKRGTDWVVGRSHCDSCKHRLEVKDLVPLLSWLSAGGKCRYCGVALSVAYPLTELLMGISFAFSYVFWPYQLNDGLSVLALVVWLLALVLMGALVVYDLRWFMLPNKLVYPLISAGVVWAAIDILQNGLSVSILVEYALAIAVGAGVFWLLYILSKGKWIGDGDIRLGVAIGLFSGSALGSWLVVFIASVAGVVVSVPLMLRTSKPKRMKLKIPFGPMLIFGLIVVVLFGSEFLDWYLREVLYL